MPDSTYRPGTASGRALLEPFQGELTQLRMDDALRLQRMVDLRAVMESFRRDSISRILPSDYGRNGPVMPSGSTDVRLPYLLAICVKHAHRAGGQMPDVRIPRADSSNEERWRQSVLERFLACCWNDSDSLVQLTSAAWDASCVGTGAFDVYWKADKQVACFYARDPAGMVVVPDPYTVWPYQRAYRSWLSPIASVRATYAGKQIDPADEKLGRPQVDQLVPVEGVSGTMCQINEVKDEKQCLRWSGDVLLHRSDHGADICPVVMYPNVGPCGWCSATRTWRWRRTSRSTTSGSSRGRRTWRRSRRAAPTRRSRPACRRCRSGRSSSPAASSRSGATARCSRSRRTTSRRSSTSTSRRPATR